MSDAIYLDYNASTPIDGDVLEAMRPWLTEAFANPASHHLPGRMAQAAVDGAREQLAELIAARPVEVVFTSGATEANNLALLGAIAALPDGRRRVLAPVTEHKAVLEPLNWAQDNSYKIDFLPVAANGLLDLDHLASSLGTDVGLVTVMLANNETGVIQPLARINELAHEVGAVTHTDATQAAGRLAIDVDELGVDMASLSGHKMYGPKGAGALYVRRGTPVEPLMHGGGHERGLRPGTLNVPGIVGIGAAAAIAGTRLAADEQHFAQLIEDLHIELVRASCAPIDFVSQSSGAAEPPRLANTRNWRFVGADADAVMANAPTLALSSGSACTSSVPGPSHVLRAMLADDEAASECLRISVGRSTTRSEVVEAAKLLAAAVNRVRDLAQRAVPANAATTSTPAGALA